VPPLRERVEDIPQLIDYFVGKKSRKPSKLHFSSDALETMMRYHWPGNVRELLNVIERAIVLETTDLSVLLPSINPPMSPVTQMIKPQSELFSLPYKDAKKSVLDEFEKAFFENLLKKTGGNISKTALEAKIHRKNLHVKLSELGIDPKQFSQPSEINE
jgi:DNA-binding NtrC family response regulator